MRLSQRNEVIVPGLIALVALLANAAILVLHTYPAWRERAAAQAMWDNADSKLHTVRQQIRTLETIGRGALAADDDLQGFLDQRLLDSAALQRLLQHVRTSAAASGVTLERIDHSMESIARLDAVRWQMSTRGAGSYAALRAWMSALRDGPGLVFVDRVEAGSSGGSLLSVEVTVVAVLRADAAVMP